MERRGLIRTRRSRSRRRDPAGREPADAPANSDRGKLIAAGTHRGAKTGRRYDPPLRRSLRPPGPVQFELSRYRRARLSILEVRGELDLLTAPRLAAELHAIVRGTEGDLVIDLREAVFIDSAGLHVLLNAHRRLGRAGRKLTVVCGEGPVKHVIELARLADTLGVTTGIDQHDPADRSCELSSR